MAEVGLLPFAGIALQVSKAVLPRYRSQARRRFAVTEPRTYSAVALQFAILTPNNTSPTSLQEEPIVPEFRQDPIINVIHNSMRKGINLTLEHECYASAIVLILSAIDAMAYLSMEEDQQDVYADDFIAWADRYIHFPGKHQLTGTDLYGARCAMLHNFGAQSKMSRNGKCRVILWMDRAQPPILFRPNVNPGYVMVSIVALRDALFEGMDRFLINLYKNPKSKEARLADKRFQSFVHTTPVDDVISRAPTT